MISFLSFLALSVADSMAIILAAISDATLSCIERRIYELKYKGMMALMSISGVYS